MIGTGFGPSYYIVNPGTVIDMTGIMIVEWDNGSISLYEFDDPGLNFIEPTPP
jgi:hypothetical protein